MQTLAICIIFQQCFDEQTFISVSVFMNLQWIFVQRCARVIFFESESQALRGRVESESSKSFFESSLGRIESESNHTNCQVTLSHWFASSRQCRVTWNFTFFLWLVCYEMVPNKLSNGAW